MVYLSKATIWKQQVDVLIKLHLDLALVIQLSIEFDTMPIVLKKIYQNKPNGGENDEQIILATTKKNPE